MKALLLEAKQKLKMKEIPTPKISENDVLVKVAYCGICGSDLPRFFEGAVHQFPQILGHEFSGTIEACGSKVTTLAVGDRVAVAPLTVCGHCEYCLAGYPQMCENYGFIGSHQAGAFAEYVAVPEQNIIKVPETVSLKEAALIEPFTVGLHAVERLPIKANDEILVLGAGTIGLMTILALRARGVGNISVSEINDNRLRFAKLAGADQLINPMKTQLEDYVLEHGRPHSVFETAGHPLTQVPLRLRGRKGK
ncbi:alcohol dehydrogenase catalytic domain-containing protein [Enterococcus termitis]